MAIPRRAGAVLARQRDALLFEIIRQEPAGSPLHPFELGHFRFTYGSSRIDTTESQRLAHMVHLSLQDLSDGLLSIAEGAKGFLMMAVASSFELDVRRRRDKVDLSAGSSCVEDIPLGELLNTVATTTSEHLAQQSCPVPAPPILRDLEQNILKLKSVAHARRAS
ncbi:hypothetical protein [Stenotrophomonas indicatrix]|uniref:hypothetical protein n=1 Tax=Stenotrophomonas indicatrix TaxID=2045451 RepID=UPI0028A99F94|nr:hypothetical protein [Stenotrophomonas indicatrix]